jgi:hypothetical protein
MNKYDQVSLEWLKKKFSTPEGVTEFQEYMDSLFERRFTLKHANVKKQELAYWKKEGLYEVLNVSEDREWTRFHFFDYVWLKLVSELRKFDMPVKEIYKVRQQFFTLNDDTIRTLLTSGLDEAANYPATIAVDAKDFKNEEFNLIAFMYRKYFPPFNLFVLSLLLDRRRLNLLVNFNGERGWFSPDLMDNPDLFTEFLTFSNQAHVSIPVHKILDEFYENPEIKLKDIQQVFQLTKTEIKLFEIIRTEGITEVKIKLKPDKGGYILVETVYNENIEKTILQLDRIVNKEGYQVITIKTENNSIRHLEIRKKIKI